MFSACTVPCTKGRCMFRIVVCLTAMLPLVACGSSSSPTAPAAAAVTRAARLLEGSTIDAISGSPLANVSVQIAGAEARSDTQGRFQLSFTDASALRATLRGSDVIERQALLRADGSRASLSLIPASFDMGAFD